MKKNKKVVISIIILLVIIIALAGLMIYGIAKGESFIFSGKTEVLYESTFNDINKIDVNVASYDVLLKEYDQDEIKVEITGSEKNKDKIKVEENESELTIRQDGSIICIGFCFYKEEITIYVPENYELEYNHESSSGSIVSDILIQKGNIKTTSGDIKLATLLNGNVAATSGNIELTEGESLEVSSTSGDIDIEKINNLTGSATSGNLTVDNLTNKINFGLTSGDIKINKFSINEDSRLTATSGNIKLGLEKEVFIDAKTNSGDIDIDNTNVSPILTLTTTSGDITAK